MKFLLVLSLFILSFQTWAQNPFQNYLTAELIPTTEFYPQKAPFAYPFEVSNKVINAGLDQEKVTTENPTDALNFVASLFAPYPFLNSLFMYQYDFPVHPNWAILPHAFVPAVKEPKKWIEHFKHELAAGEGINGRKFHQELDVITKTRAYSNNLVKLNKSPESFSEIVKGLAGTKDHAFMTNYLFHCDKGSETLLNLIGEKSKAGVRVFIILDKLFSKSDPACVSKLRKLGAKVLLLRGEKISYILHEKMFVYDGKYALIDGQNIIAPQTLSQGVNNLYNDTSIGVRGPMVTQIAERFIHHWEVVLKGKLPKDIIAFYQEQALADEKFATDESIAASLAKSSGQGLCRLVTKDPGIKNSQILDLFLHTVKNTKNYLFFNYIDAQFKNLTGKETGATFFEAVTQKANQHPELRVDLLTNNWRTATEIDLPEGSETRENFFTKFSLFVVDLLMKKPITQMYKIKDYLEAKLEGNNFHWWSYGQYMHAKTMMSDNIWTIVGTHNLNTTSEKLSYEMVLACVDTGLAEEMQKSIVVDALNSIPVPLNSN